LTDAIEARCRPGSDRLLPLQVESLKTWKSPMARLEVSGVERAAPALPIDSSRKHWLVFPR